MYHVLSPQAVVENVTTLAAPYLQDKTQVTPASLKQAYRAYLTQLQPHCPYIYNEQLFHSDLQTEQRFADYFASEEVDTRELDAQVDPSNVMYPNADKRRQVLQEGLAQIERAEPTFSQVFTLVMNTVFCTVTPRIGGTSVNPKFIGVMCAYHDMTAEESVVAELLIHEFTHNTLFLDELRYGHYKDRQLLQNPATHLAATDRGVHFNFPFHRILHSLFVSAEVLTARQNYIGHETRINQHLSSAQILERSKKYIAEIKKNKAIDALMTERCHKLFAACEQFYGHYRR